MLGSRSQAIVELPGGYTIRREIGEGAFATVYEGVDARNERVAIKLLTSNHSQARQRFQREVKVMKSLPKNRYVVGYVDDGFASDGTPFIVMEFVKGFTLGKLLRSGRRLTESAASRLMMQLCEAFSALHKLGLSHGDIKPDNIMLSKSPVQHGSYETNGGPGAGTRDVVHLAQVERSGMTMKLLDFGQVRDSQGLLKLFEEEAILQGADFCVDLDSGMVAGTPEYVSPEQVRDAKRTYGDVMETDTASDVFGLAVIFYELLSGETPWPFEPRSPEGRLYVEDARSYLETRADGHPLPRAPSNCSPALWSVIARALNPDPRKRQGDAHALAADVDRYDRYGVGVPGDLDNEETVMAYLPDLDKTTETDMSAPAAQDRAPQPEPEPEPEKTSRVRQGWRVDKRARLPRVRDRLAGLMPSSGAINPRWRVAAICAGAATVAAAGTYALVALGII